MSLPDAAVIYQVMGWPVVPVRYEGGQKKPALRGITGRAGVDLTPGQLAAVTWTEGMALGSRMPVGFLGVDIDAYGTKRGAETLALAEQHWGPLPQGPWSSSRDDGVSGIRLFRVPPDVEFVGEIRFGDLADIELIQRHHRYAVVWPSRHIKTGALYTWRDVRPGARLPFPYMFPELPQAWVDGLRAPTGTAVAGRRVQEAEVAAWLGALPEPGARCPYVDRVLSEIRLTGSRYGAARDATLALVRAGEQGHHGAQDAIDELRCAYVAEVSPDRASAEQEFDRHLAGAVSMVLATPTAPEDKGCCGANRDPAWLREMGERGVAAAVSTLAVNGSAAANGSAPGPAPAPLADEEAFWTARPELDHVRRFALPRRCSPWAVLGVVLTRVVCATPPKVQLPPLVGGRASLNLFVALVGLSGGGKGAAQTVGAEAVDVERAYGLSMPRSVSFATHTVGSGQGLAHAYVRWEKGTGMVPYATSALFTIEEVDHLVGLTGQNGSTLLPELRRLYMGEKLGHMYVDVQKRAEVPAHSYRAGLIMGVQPARAGVLLDDADGGTPQRVLWFEVAYPHPDEKPEPTQARWPWNPPRWNNDHVVVNGSGPAMPHAALATMAVPKVAADEIDAAALARARGLGDPLDGHRLLAQEKVAAALAIFAGRADIIEEDWQLAKVVMAHSDGVRARVVATLAQRARERNVARAAVEAERAVVVADAVEDGAVVRVCRGVVRALDRLGGEATEGQLRRAVAARDRGYIEESLSRLVGAGLVTVEATDNRGVEGRRYRRAGGAS
jgi:hypothetical protein